MRNKNECFPGSSTEMTTKGQLVTVKGFQGLALTKGFRSKRQFSTLLINFHGVGKLKIFDLFCCLLHFELDCYLLKEKSLISCLCLWR